MLIFFVLPALGMAWENTDNCFKDTSTFVYANILIYFKESNNLWKLYFCLRLQKYGCFCSLNPLRVQVPHPPWTSSFKAILYLQVDVKILCCLQWCKSLFLFMLEITDCNNHISRTTQFFKFIIIFCVSCSQPHNLFEN